MAFNRPTLPELIDTITTNLVTRLSIVTTVLRRATVRILAFVYAEEANDLHGHLEYNSQQIFVSTADEDNLILHGADLEEPRKPATFATGSIDIIGAPDGTVLPAASVFQRDDGVEYVVNADTPIAGGVATVAVTAVVEGADGNADSGTAVTLSTAIAGIQSAATVDASGIGGGVDLEDIELYRQRLQDKKANPPASGNKNDYIRWAKEVAGITRAWVIEEGAGPGTVQVYVMADDADDGPFADDALIAAAQTYLDDDDHHIIASHITVLTPIANPLSPTIHIVPDNAANRAAVIVELQDLISRNQDPAGVTIPLSLIKATVEETAGIIDSAVTVPAADFVTPEGQIATWGAPTWD